MRALAIAAVLFLLAVSASFGGAAEASGSARLNSGGLGSVESTSCATAGECAAGGYYIDGHSHTQAFVVSETNGSWGTAIKVPGTAALNIGGDAKVYSISCAAAGECAAGGYYVDGHSHRKAFVVSETNGSWGTAIEVPGTANLNGGRDAEVDSVSCGAAGDCAAGGYDDDGLAHRQAFVVSEKNGSWGTAIEVPGTDTLNTGAFAVVNSISCAAAGECAAGGFYNSDGNYQAFVVSETNGTWGTAIEVPGTATLNTGGDAGVGSISCAAAGECAAGGAYSDVPLRTQAFVVSETNGSWGDAIEVPGTATLNVGDYASVGSISCAAAGDCAAGGSYDTGNGGFQAFVVDETNGSWGTAIEAPGTATLNTGGYAAVGSISCAAAGDCTTGGGYVAYHHGAAAFVASETNGSWDNAVEVPGTAIGGGAEISSISCAGVEDCAAGGFYSGFRTGGVSWPRAFVVNETNGSWGSAAILHGFPAVCVVPKVVGKALSAAKKRLHAAGCRVGKIAYVYSGLRRGRVVAQRPASREVLSVRTGVALTVSKGKRPKAG